MNTVKGALDLELNRVSGGTMIKRGHTRNVMFPSLK